MKILKICLVLIIGIGIIFVVGYMLTEYLTLKNLAVSEPVPNEVIVLVHSGNHYGGFILINQTINPERAQYKWYYRSDGKGVFRKYDPSIHRGEGTTFSINNNSPISFGPFQIQWSGHEDGRGWIYYQHFAGDTIEPNAIYICVTSEQNIDNIDALDPKWVYRASPVD